MSRACSDIRSKPRLAATSPTFAGFLDPEAGHARKKLRQQSLLVAAGTENLSSRNIAETRDDSSSTGAVAAQMVSPLIGHPELDSIREVGSKHDEPKFGGYSLEEFEVGRTLGRGTSSVGAAIMGLKRDFGEDFMYFIREQLRQHYGVYI